jgi:tetratricopeptide (TPR) repeat protein
LGAAGIARRALFLGARFDFIPVPARESPQAAAGAHVFYSSKSTAERMGNWIAFRMGSKRLTGEAQRSQVLVPLAAIAFFVVASVRPVSSQSPQAPDPQRQTALSLEQQGNTTEAEAAWRSYLTAHPSNPEPYAHLGLLEARQGHFNQAVPLYRKALKLGPEIPGLRLNLGLALFKSGDLKGAIEVFQPLLKSNPDNEQLNTLIGMAHYGLAEYAEAAPFLTKAAAQDPSNLPLRLALAHSCLWSKQMQCVLDVYKEILALNSESAEADMLAGEAMNGLKDNEGAAKMFRAALQANPTEPSAHFALGYLLWMNKQYPEAAAEFQAELANDPGHLQASLYLADCDIQLNHQQDARPLLERIVHEDGNLAMAHIDLGSIYADAGQNDDALRELLLAEKLAPDEVNVHWRLGRLYKAMGNRDASKAEFDKAVNLNRATDEDLYKKIANGRNQPPPASAQPTENGPEEKGK